MDTSDPCSSSSHVAPPPYHEAVASLNDVSHSQGEVSEAAGHPPPPYIGLPEYGYFLREAFARLALENAPPPPVASLDDITQNSLYSLLSELGIMVAEKPVPNFAVLSGLVARLSVPLDPSHPGMVMAEQFLEE